MAGEGYITHTWTVTSQDRESPQTGNGPYRDPPRTETSLDRDPLGHNPPDRYPSHTQILLLNNCLECWDNPSFQTQLLTNACGNITFTQLPYAWQLRCIELDHDNPMTMKTQRVHLTNTIYITCPSTYLIIV